MIDGHTNAITANDLTADMKRLATVSLDSTIKVCPAPKNYIYLFHFISFNFMYSPRLSHTSFH